MGDDTGAAAMLLLLVLESIQYSYLLLHYIISYLYYYGIDVKEAVTSARTAQTGVLRAELARRVLNIDSCEKDLPQRTIRMTRRKEFTVP